MNRQNIEQIIRDLFRQGYNAYRESYPDQIMEAIKTARVTAAGYWGTRTPDEEQRDEKAGVTLRDYENWVLAELSDLIPAASNKFQTWAAEIKKDWDGRYTANATEDTLAVSFDSEEVARIDYNNGRYTVTGADEHAVEQLQYMVTR